MALAPDDPRHGTDNGYRNHGCHCTACRHAHNKEMSRRLDIAMRERTCPHCFGPGGLMADHRCRACYEYERRTGRPRPARLFTAQPRVCDNCGDTVASGKPIRRGRCDACARYWERNGRERPDHLILRNGSIL